jgi:long-chain acyl-CoA synthetase
MDAKVRELNLTSLEKIKAIHFCAEPFTIDNNLITPTFKLKRNIAKVHFKAALDKMYAETQV